MSDTQAIENLINGYATCEDSSFLIRMQLKIFLAVRPSGNPIYAQEWAYMFNSKDLVAESSELIKNPQNWNLRLYSLRDSHFEWNLHLQSKSKYRSFSLHMLI